MNDTHGPSIRICNEELIPDPLGALYWPREHTLIVADLHFEKGSSFAPKGVLLPPYDTRTTLMRLRALMRRYCPLRVISLGDAFHDGDAEMRIDPADAEFLTDLMSETEWIWVLGNHDPEPPARFAAQTHNEMKLGPFVLCHEPQTAPAPGEIAGHLHPCARVRHEGRTLRRRCFAVCSGGERLVMPALGAYTGGLNILDEAFAPLFEAPVAWVMGEEGVYPIGAHSLAPDPGAAWKDAVKQGARG
ncbi:MAG: ligase-associated DNA damage response endonuclease PdeM [Pseudomonadota bacterium]